MQFDQIKQSEIMRTGGEQLSDMRAVLNSASSSAPPELAEVFAAALDQVADQQIKVTEAFTRLITTEDLGQAEATIANAVQEGKRASLRAVRSYADDQAAKTNSVHSQLGRLPRDNASLIEEKGRLDQQFRTAVELHEKDDFRALKLLLDVALLHAQWCTKVQAAIVGAEGLIKAEKRRVRLQSVTIIIALAALVIAILSYFKK